MEQKMAAVYGTLCTIPPRNCKKYGNSVEGNDGRLFQGTISLPVDWRNSRELAGSTARKSLQFGQLLLLQHNNYLSVI
jgi:hypothetical protein